ncbi:MAG TPA: hypothetical protein VMB48_01170 [Steroidobacteraceae bacterium]|nr:hypothetical protein [Steroidobacteraceae bacterium]
MELFDALGFEWDRAAVPRDIPRASVERAVFRFHRMLPEYVWDAGVLEGNPFTFPEVKTLLEGVTVGGRKLSDQEQILNLAESSRRLLELVKNREFRLDKSTFCALHALVARDEALPGAGRLGEVFSEGLRVLERDVTNAYERATAFFLFGSLQQFFFDGNKRTSRFMMNGVLMSEGIDAVSIPAIRAAEFNARMVDFYTSRNGTGMMAFVLDCHPEAARIRQLNPWLSAVHEASTGIEYHRLDDAGTSRQGSRGGQEAARDIDDDLSR